MKRERGMIADEEEAALAQSRLGKFPFEQQRAKSVIGGGSSADFEFFGQLGSELTLFDPIASHVFAGGIIAPVSLMVVFGGEFVDVEVFLAQGSFLAAGAGALFVFDLDRESLADGLDRFGEAELLSFTHESNHIARLTTAEALVEPLIWIDMEGGRFLVMEGAESLHSSSRFAQSDHSRDDIRDVYAEFQVAHTGGFDDGHGTG